jgi:hypothetical protein
MFSITIGAVTFVCAFGGAILGMYLRGILPDHHLREDSKDAMKTGIAIVATLSALVLGLLISSAKNALDSTNNAFTQSGAKIIMLDRVLKVYGPEANEPRAILKATLQAIVDRSAVKDKNKVVKMPTNGKTVGMELVLDSVRSLAPQTDSQTQIQSQAVELCNDLMLSRWLVMEQSQVTVPATLLVILIFWLTILFVSCGLFSPYNSTVIIVLLVCAMSVSSAIFLIEDISKPFDGMIQASTGPLTTALERLGR